MLQKLAVLTLSALALLAAVFPATASAQIPWAYVSAGIAPSNGIWNTTTSSTTSPVSESFSGAGGSCSAYANGGITPSITATAYAVTPEQVFESSGQAGCEATLRFQFRVVTSDPQGQGPQIPVIISYSGNLALQSDAAPFSETRANVTLWGPQPIDNVPPGWGMAGGGGYRYDLSYDIYGYNYQAYSLSVGFGGAPTFYVAHDSWTPFTLDGSVGLNSGWYTSVGASDSGSIRVDPVQVSISPAWLADHPNDYVELDSISSAPEPASLALLAAALSALALRRRLRHPSATP